MNHGFYSLDEAAKKLTCEINDLLKKGADGKIELCIYYRGDDFSTPPEIDPDTGVSFRRRVEKFLTISKLDIMRAYQETKEILTAKDVPNFDYVSLVDWGMNYKVPSPFTSKSLYLTKETFDNLKAEQESSFEKSSPCLDEDEKSKKSNLHIIGALLQIVMDGGKFKSEIELRQHIAHQYTGFMGCSETTLAKRFKAARDLLSD